MSEQSPNHSASKFREKEFTNSYSKRNSKTSVLMQDRKLVKIPLPINPLDFINSNKHFKKKSENFVNYITEKSINIIDQMLLYQQQPSRCHTEHNDQYISRTETDFSDSEQSFDYQSKVQCSEFPAVSNLSSENVITQTNAGLNEYKFLTMSSSYHFPEITGKQLESIANELCHLQKRIFSKIEYPEHFLNGIETMSTISKLKTAKNHNEVSDGEGSKALLSDPVYLILLNSCINLRNDNNRLLKKIDRLEDKNRYIYENSSEESLEVETLKNTIDRLSHELKKSLEYQETANHNYSLAIKEKENILMRYASSEKQLIDAQKSKEYSERKVQQITKDNEMLQNKLKHVQNEQNGISSILDGKCAKLVELQRQIRQLKNDINIRDAKLKWNENKFKTEMESQKEMQEKLDKAMAKIMEVNQERELIHRNEESKVLDQQRKEEQVRLILERHVTEDKEILRLQLQKDIDVLNSRQNILIEENKALNLKVQELNTERIDQDNLISELKIRIDQQQDEITELTEKNVQMESLNVQLKQQEQSLYTFETIIDELRTTNVELQASMNECRFRETSMLDFTQRLTEKNTIIQSECTSLKTKVQELECDQGPLHERVNNLNVEIERLQCNLTEEKKKRLSDCETLAKYLAEQIQLVHNLNFKLKHYQGENKVLKRKLQISLQEINRELVQSRKKLDAFQMVNPREVKSLTSPVRVS